MPKCIICRKEETNFNEEHVIPEAIGGCYKIYGKVCIDCNERMGTEIDAKLTNHILVLRNRFQNNLTGKKGRFPHQPDYPTVNQDKIEKVKIKGVDANGKFKFSIVRRQIDFPDYRVVFIDKGNISENERNKIIQDYADKKGVKKEDIKCERKDYSEPIAAIIPSNIEELKMPILKIAYEFAVDSIPEYFDTEEAKNISSILHNNQADMLNRANLFLSGDTFNFFKMFKLRTENHYMFLINDLHKGLIAKVQIFDAIAETLRLGPPLKQWNGDFILAVNDTKGKIFRSNSPGSFEGFDLA